MVDPLSEQGASSHARARANGVSARDRQREKHAQYPGAGLVAAVVEAGGRLGGEFQAFLKSHALPAIFDEDLPLRTRALQDVRMGVVIAVARGTAAMLLSAAGDAPPVAPGLTSLTPAETAASVASATAPLVPCADAGDGDVGGRHVATASAMQRLSVPLPVGRAFSDVSMASTPGLGSAASMGSAACKKEPCPSAHALVERQQGKPACKKQCNTALAEAARHAPPP